MFVHFTKNFVLKYYKALSLEVFAGKRKEDPSTLTWVREPKVYSEVGARVMGEVGDPTVEVSKTFWRRRRPGGKGHSAHKRARSIRKERRRKRAMEEAWRAERPSRDLLRKKFELSEAAIAKIPDRPVEGRFVETCLRGCGAEYIQYVVGKAHVWDPWQDTHICSALSIEEQRARARRNASTSMAPLGTQGNEIPRWSIQALSRKVETEGCGFKLPPAEEDEEDGDELMSLI